MTSCWMLERVQKEGGGRSQHGHAIVSGSGSHFCCFLSHAYALDVIYGIRSQLGLISKFGGQKCKSCFASRVSSVNRDAIANQPTAISRKVPRYVRGLLLSKYRILLMYFPCRGSSTHRIYLAVKFGAKTRICLLTTWRWHTLCATVCC